MKLDKGLNTDLSPIDLPEGYYLDARNMLFSRKYNAMSNEDGFNELFTLPATPIGTITLNNDDWVVFCSDPTYDEIGLVSNGTYTRVLKTTSVSDRLNLSTDYPVKGRFRVSNRGERIISFTDNNNPPRILNIDTLPFPVDVTKVPTQSGSINVLNIFSAGDPPTIATSLNNTGGFLKSGTYFFSCSYTATDNTETGYFTAVGPVKITDDTTSVGAARFDGAPAGTITSKSIRLVLSGVDNRYRFLNIGVISVIGGVQTFNKVGQVEIVDGTTTYSFTYTGNETTTTLNLEQLVIQSQGIYQTAKAIAVINDRLVLGNLGSRAPFDYQAYANNIDITWEHQLIDVSNSASNLQAINNLQENCFRAFEIYAFYIVFRYKDGSYSPAYHIPGRTANAGDTDNVVFASSLGTVKKYQVYDTCLTDGTMSYWENENETYPTDFPDFAGQKVRHHKFPSINFIKTNGVTLGYSAADVAAIGLTKLPRLYFRASNVIVPAGLQSQIDGWQIYFAKRDINNQTCVGQGHLIFAHQHSGNTSNLSPNSNVYYGPVNARTSLVKANPLIDLDAPITKPCPTKVSFHSPDLILNKPQVVPSYVRNEILLTSLASSGATSGQIIQSVTDAYLRQYVLIDYVTSSSNATATAASFIDIIRSVTPNNPLYVPNNVISGSIYNYYSSEYISLDIELAGTLTLPGVFTDNVIPRTTNTAGYSSANTKEATYLSNLCQLLRNVYSPFTTQDLVASSDIIASGTTSTVNTIVRGDNYIADYSFTSTIFKHLYHANNTIIDDDQTDGNNDIPDGLRYIRRYATECNINIKMRHEGVDNNSKYYGKSSYPISSNVSLRNSYLKDWDSSKPYIIEFNSDYNVVNTFNPVFPRNTTIDTLERFPYRIIMSEKNSNELADSGWRTFLPNNYKDMLTTKGEITNLESYDDVLLIHLENSLFRTVGAQSLKTGTVDVYVGSGEIFANEPKEVLASEMGYLGNQNMFGCGVTKLGYVFFDASQGKLFVVSDKIAELSSKGLRNYLRDNFINDPVVDNPFTSTGITIAYDEKYNRLIISKKGENSFTLSYSPDIEGFVSFHDYVPDWMIGTRNKVFSIKDNVVYEHNHTTKASYYDQTVYPTYITPVVNIDNVVNKHFRSVSWNTELVNSSGTSLFHKTFTEILLYNSYQCSGNITLSYPNNIFNSETTWNFNNFYDVVRDRSLPFMDSSGLILSNLNSSMSWFKQRRFVDKWLAMKLTYDNTDQNTLFLYDVSTLMRKSGR